MNADPQKKTPQKVKVPWGEYIGMFFIFWLVVGGIVCVFAPENLGFAIIIGFVFSLVFNGIDFYRLVTGKKKKSKGNNSDTKIPPYYDGGASFQ